jgi:hypothetical protein
MRRRINRTLLTATAASASVITLSFMATGAVGAATTTAALASGTSSVTPILSQATGTSTDCAAPTEVTPSGCAVAGYQASGRLFRYAQASIVVPNHTVAFTGTTGTGAGGEGSTTPVEPDGAAYVALDNSSDTANDFTRVGIVACAHISTASTAGVWPCPGTGLSGSVTAGWYVFAAVVQPDITTQMTPVTHLLDASQYGLGVTVSIYLSPTGNSVHALIKTPTTYTTGTTTVLVHGHTYNDTFGVNGPTYSNADAVVDWTGVAGTGILAPFQPIAAVTAGYPGSVAYTQFKDGRFTTWNGTRGTFNGKWTVTPFEATVDGTSATAVVTSPGYLWSSTTGYKSDSFGVWLRHV